MHQTQTIVDESSALEPLTIQDARDQVRIYTDELDRQLVEAVSEVRAYCETYVGRTLRTEVTRQLAVDEWWSGRVVRLPWPPLTLVSWVKYYDSDNVDQTVDTDDYRVHMSGQLYGVVEFVKDWVKPTVYDRLDAIRIQYIAGYETRVAVPQEIRRAMKILLSLEFDDVPPNREANALARAKACLTAADVGSYR